MLGDAGGWRSELVRYTIGIEPRIVLSGITDFNRNDDAPKASYLGQGGAGLRSLRQLRPGGSP
ncbi:hypothetical protein [Pseudomonas sp.]|uniref:hypothetical protein n=1 Tax=Pseudomonas sp. TaxID=306 RepID=UPI003CC61307